MVCLCFGRTVCQMEWRMILQSETQLTNPNDQPNLAASKIGLELLTRY
jgi:hypothetical protein